MPQFRHSGLRVPSVMLSDRCTYITVFLFFSFQPIALAAFVIRITIVIITIA